MKALWFLALLGWHGVLACCPEAGIEVLGIQRSAAGYMLDLRYRVVDAEKAARYLYQGMKTVVLGPEGTKLYTPSPSKIGPLRQVGNVPQEGKIYFVLFANPGRYVKAGDKVTVILGDLRIENLEVQ